MAKRLKILSIDGGGIRGIIPATVLMELERRCGKPIAQIFDLIAGTSTGGILAAGVAVPDANGNPKYTAEQLRQLYFEKASVIFPHSIWREIRTGGNLLEEKYPAEGIESVLKEYFGETRLRDALTNLLITSYEIEIRMPWLFRSDRAKKNPDFDFPMWQVARGTSAAPTYFEPEKIEKNGGAGFWALVDGGTYANNPAMCAYAEARRLYPERDILIVSVGTGSLIRPIHYEDAKGWGLAGWAKPILNIVFDGVARTTEYQLHQLLSGEGDRQRYFRFQTDLTIASDDMDDTSSQNLKDLQTQAEQLIGERDLEFGQLVEQLTAS